MASFSKIKSTVVQLLVDNIDTDQIIPARFLKVTDKAGLGEKLFADWRYQEDGALKKEFVLNSEKAKKSRILLAGDNFGCGSSREHAPWALVDYGFRVVISTSFADIFRNNALKNGLLPVIAEKEAHRKVTSILRENPETEIEIDLAEQKVRLPDGTQFPFPIDAFSRTCLLNGVDELGYILSLEPHIARFEKKKNNV